MSKNPAELKYLQGLPLEKKIQLTQERIRAWYDAWVRFEIENMDTGKRYFKTFDMRDRYEPPLADNEFALSEQRGAVYVSFSGGKDSTVLKHIVDGMYDDVPALFVNTGLEYPEIQKFAMSQKNVVTVRPEMRFDEVIRKYGYPVVSKEISEAARKAKPGTTRYEKFCGTYLGRNGELSQFNFPQWKYLLDAPFRCSEQCCDVMKKAPATKYEKSTGRKPMLALLACESNKRKRAWEKTGCNAFEKKRAQSQPMAFWTEQDILHYIKKYDVPYCSVYGDIQIKPHGEDAIDGQIDLIDYLGCYEPEDTLETTGCDRTGCVFCGFGCHLQPAPNRFQRLKETHPRQYQYCIGGGEFVDGKWQPNKDGLGLGYVLDYIGVKYD